MKKLFRSTLIVFVIVLQSSITQAQLSNSFPTSGLVAYYPFNGNANDQSGNGNNGTVNGATLTTDRFGNANSAYSFNGINNYISVPNSPSLQNLNSISMSAWVYINAWYKTNADYFPILHKSNQQSAYGEYSVLLSSTSVISTLINQENVASDTNWNFKSWYNVLVTISSSDTTSVYINGNAIYSGISTSHSLNTVDSLPLLIGVDYPSFIEYANGKIDDIGLWARALTQTEIAQLYNPSDNLVPSKPKPADGRPKSISGAAQV